MMMKTCKRKSLATGNSLICLKSPKLPDRNRRKNLLSSNPKSIALGRSGKKGELENFVYSDTKLQAMWGYLSGPIKLTNASWTTMSSKGISSANWNNSKPVTIPGLGLLMTFQTKSQRLTSFARNLLQRKSTSDLKYNSIKPSISMLKFWRNRRKSLLKSQLKRCLKQKLRKQNECDCNQKL